MNNSESVVRVSFYGNDDFLISSENLVMTNGEVMDYIETIISGELPESIGRVVLFSRDRKFRKIAIDRRAA
jgi:hypothetical protein